MIDINSGDLFLKIEISVLYNVVLDSAVPQVNQRYVYMCLFLLSLPPTSYPTPLGHHRTLSWDPRAMQQLPASYLL